MEVRVEKREFRAETVLLAACRKLSFSFLAHDQEKKVWRGDGDERGACVLKTNLFS